MAYAAVSVDVLRNIAGHADLSTTQRYRTPTANRLPARQKGSFGVMPVEHLTSPAEHRAVEVQLLLADRGQHRAPSILDLLVAATAEVANLTVLASTKTLS